MVKKIKRITEGCPGVDYVNCKYASSWMLLDTGEDLFWEDCCSNNECTFCNSDLDGKYIVARIEIVDGLGRAYDYES